MNKKNKGRKGEDLAVSYLIKKKVKILERNFRSRYGEIDIIGLSNKKRIIFYEVKYREDDSFGDIGYSINERKKERMLKTAVYFLLLNQNYADHDTRFDAVLIYNRDNNIEISSVENIISADNIKNGSDFFY